MMGWYFLIFFLTTSAFGGEVVSFETYLKKTKRSCTTLLSSEGRPSAKILPFGPRDPEFFSPQNFLENFHENEAGIFYLYSSEAPDFSRRALASWSVLVPLSGARDLYVLKVSAFDPGFAEKALHQGSWSMAEIREGGRLISFTRLPLHPLFSAVKNMVEQIRGIECHDKSIAYVPPRFLEEEILSLAPVSVRLQRFLNSWVPLSLNEEALKEEAKGFFAVGFDKYGEQQAVSKFLEKMEAELLRRYSPEQVESLLSYVRGRL